MNDINVQGIKILVEKYRDLQDSKKVNDYNEEETKIGFILPLFEALGWRINDKYEVSSEEQQSGGRVDHGFYLNGRAKFYLEAKSLKVDLNREEFANQAIRYSWNKGVTWAILTDFESIKVFNAEVISENLGNKLFFEIRWDEYLERIDQLSLLSRGSFVGGRLDKEAEKYGKKLKSVSVGDSLYKDLKECRVVLTKSISTWNPNVDPVLLDEGVQKLLDRLIFIRVAEDRGVESEILTPMVRQWQSHKGETTLFKTMIEKFRELDDIYNSNLFSPHPFEEWDEYSNATKDVIDILYGKKAYYEYDFKLIPSDVLGSVYENYLGYKLSKSKKGLSVDKDSGKRKEQGIYYTPSYIVDYIVENTLKPVLDKCTSVEELKKIKVLDPACGSGSFLIKAMDMIHKKYVDFGYKDEENTRIMILSENIYGVDLDSQAVEIARLNLLINTLQQRIKLPSLTKNIKNGNSLISGTDEELKKYFGNNYKDQKPFNWKEEFPEVFSRGGFDVIIGNPPYGVSFDLESKNYLHNLFPTVPDREIYIYFISRGLSLLKPDGVLSYIFPNTFLTNLFGVKYRKNLLENFTIGSIADLSKDNTFQEANVRTCIINIINNKSRLPLEISNFEPVSKTFVTKGEIPEDYLSDYVDNWMKFFSTSNDDDLIISKIKALKAVEIDRICEVSQGLIPYDKYRGHDEATIKNRIWHSDIQKDPSYRKELKGADISRYSLTWNGKLWISYGSWLAAPRDPKFFNSPRILIREIVGDTLNCSYTEEEYYNTPSIINVVSKDKSVSLYFVLALLNSKLIGWYHKKLSPKANKGLFPKILINDVRRIVIPESNERRQKTLIGYSRKMLELHNNLNIIEKNTERWNSIKSEIEKVDQRIDDEVYRLYNLSSEEVKTIENSFNNP